MSVEVSCTFSPLYRHIKRAHRINAVNVPGKWNWRLSNFHEESIGRVCIWHCLHGIPSTSWVNKNALSLWYAWNRLILEMLAHEEKNHIESLAPDKFYVFISTQLPRCPRIYRPIMTVHFFFFLIPSYQLEVESKNVRIVPNHLTFERPFFFLIGTWIRSDFSINQSSPSPLGHGVSFGLTIWTPKEYKRQQRMARRVPKMSGRFKKL